MYHAQPCSYINQPSHSPSSSVMTWEKKQHALAIGSLVFFLDVLLSATRPFRQVQYNARTSICSRYYHYYSLTPGTWWLSLALHCTQVRGPPLGPLLAHTLGPWELASHFPSMPYLCRAT